MPHLLPSIKSPRSASLSHLALPKSAASAALRQTITPLRDNSAGTVPQNPSWNSTVAWADKQIATDTSYDGLGRVSGVTNPYYLNGESANWTATAYDGLGRVTSVTTPDGAETRSSYSGNTSTVTDPAEKSRSAAVDALGRTVQVVEDPGGLNYETIYGYDALDNLATVQQGGQTRTFEYDSLSRLRRSTQPENGLTTYDYDRNGNLRQKTDAQNLTTTIEYDALNRPYYRSYSDPTPPVTLTYDDAAVPYSKGRITSAEVPGARTEYREYDAAGRPSRLAQIIAGQEYPISYTYNRAGMITAETYPTGRVALPGYDTAGRVISLLTEKPGETRVSVIVPGTVTYAAQGAVATQQLGNSKWERAEFNARLQPTRMGVGSFPAHLDALELLYGYGSTDNNGNVLSQSIGAGQTVFTQNYQYDALNRLWMATDSTGWAQTYGYDRYGNRWVEPGSYCPSPNCSRTPQSPAAFNSAFNQILLPGTVYDDSGNLRTDWLGRTFDYDAENRQRGYHDAAGGASYEYDAEGRRVRKLETAGPTTTYVYDASGQLIVESSNGTPPVRELLYAGGRRVATVYGKLTAGTWTPAPPPPCLAPPQLLEPIGVIYTQTPVFRWRRDPAALNYFFQTKEEGGNWLNNWILLPAAEVCGPDTCEVTSGRLRMTFTKTAHYWTLAAGTAACATDYAGWYKFIVMDRPAIPGDGECVQGEHCSTSPDCGGTCQSGGGNVGACTAITWETCSNRCDGGWVCNLPVPPGGTQPISCPPCPGTPSAPPPPPPPPCSEKGGDYCAKAEVPSCYTGDTNLGRSSNCAYSCCKSAPPPFCGDGTCNGQEHCSTCPEDCGTCTPGPGTLGACEGLPPNHCDGKCGGPWKCQVGYPSYSWQDTYCSPCPNPTPSPTPTPPPLPTCSEKGGNYCAVAAVPSCYTGDEDLGSSINCAYSCCKSAPGPVCGDTQCNGTEHCSTCSGDCGTCSSGGGSLGSCEGLPSNVCEGKCGSGWHCELLSPPGGSQSISCPPCPTSSLNLDGGDTRRFAWHIIGISPLSIAMVWAARRRRRPKRERTQDDTPEVKR